MNIVTFGIGSEYVLKDLSSILRSKGHNVYEYEYFSHSSKLIKDLLRFRNKKVVFITSAHLTINHSTLFYLDPTYVCDAEYLISPLQIIKMIDPLLSIYIPHDLSEPFGKKNTGEEIFFNIFDYIITPDLKTKVPSNIKKNKIKPFGWIKHLDTENFYINDNVPNKKVIYFVSNFNHLRQNISPVKFSKLFGKYSDFLTIKFPSWKDCDLYEEALKKINFNFTSSNILSTKAINMSDIILTDSIGSIYSEATYFKKPIYFLCDKLLSPISYNEFKCISNSIVSLNQLEILKDLKTTNITKLIKNSFDLEKFNQLINNA